MEAAHPLLSAGSPFLPDTIDSPRMAFDDRRTRLIYRTRDEEGWVRACFERWDATRMCRGEHSPYEVVEPGRYTGPRGEAR